LVAHRKRFERFPLFCVVSVALPDFVSSGTPFAPECIADAYYTIWFVYKKFDSDLVSVSDG
jgi:hypothetical protein